MCLLKNKAARYAILALLTVSTLFFAAGCPQEATVADEDEGETEGPIIPGGIDYTSTTPDITDAFTVPTGNLVSVGLATGGATTYYLDFELGNDTNSGTSPQTPWKTLHKANQTTFQPGDHILLEADSVWNGTSVTIANVSTLLNSPEVGMLYPKGNGAEGNPIVIDLYDRLDTTGANVVYTATKRPVINGNGTPSTGTWAAHESGAITLIDQHHWEIRNIECTNMFDWTKEYYERDTTIVKKALSGILVMGYTDVTSSPNRDTYKHIVIKNCYVHDVQTEHTNNQSNGDIASSPYFGLPSYNRIKVVGGIIVGGISKYTANGVTTTAPMRFGYDGVTLEGNIVKRVALEGLRTKSEGNNRSTDMPFRNVVIRGNYIEQIAGDGIVLSDVEYGGLVESNIIKDSCAAPNLGTSNYAGVWAWYTRTDTVFQYNECYGNVYGWNDGEAWDIDNGSDKVIYQYNYSHHNAGGTILFMSSITNGIFRYNISANDGGGTKYMATVTSGVDQNASSYTSWNKGQSLFHYTNTGATASSNIPLIYNNTFYVGDGITCGVFGHHSTDAVQKYVRFYNNILLKAGEGTVYLAYGQSGDGNAGKIVNPAGFKNNLLWGYATDPETGSRAKFSNGDGDSILALTNAASGNFWRNPALKIQKAGNVTAFRAQRDTALPASAYTNAAALTAFTGKERLRYRASIFAPIDNTSQVIEKGMPTPKGAAVTELDGAWNDAPELTKDFFDAAVDTAKPPIGAAAAPYTPAP